MRVSKNEHLPNLESLFQDFWKMLTLFNTTRNILLCCTDIIIPSFEDDKINSLEFSTPIM